MLIFWVKEGKLPCCKELDISRSCCEFGENRGFVFGSGLTGSAGARSGVATGARLIGATGGATGMGLTETGGGDTGAAVTGGIIGAIGTTVTGVGV
ncbi:MAG: hypothetical protein WCD53_30485 [Microcoleus sp.]